MMPMAAPRTVTVDIHEPQDDTGYTLARHILSELDAAKGHRLFAAEIAALVGDMADGMQMGAWLRDLHARGWVDPQKVSPGSTRQRWHITDAGAVQLEEWRIDRETGMLVSNGREDEARQRYGDQRVDTWFRDVAGIDPDAARLEVPHAWQDTTPVCAACSRTLQAHKGHWTCVAPGCPRYGDSQGDGAVVA